MRLCLMVTMLLVSANAEAADARLGAAIEDFQAAWGRCSKAEMLTRSARILWEMPKDNNKVLLGVQQAEIVFIDNKACRIVLRTGANANFARITRYVRAILRNDRPEQFPKETRRINGVRLSTFKDGTTVKDKQFRGKTIIVITGPYYWQNEDIFNAEEAKIRPPTSNH